MAEVNLPPWSEISQASEGLQLTSTAATWENILARLARIESRLLEHERRAASTRPPLQPEPDPPDGPSLYTATPPPYPQFQSTGYNVTDPYTLSEFAAPQYHTTGSVQLPHSSYHTPAYTQPDGSPDSYLGFSRPPPQFGNMPYRMATSWDLPKPLAVRQTSCWDNLALRSHQGYHSYEQPTVQQPLPQCSPYCWNPLSHHCSPTAPAPLPAATPPHASNFRHTSHLHLPSSMETEGQRTLQEGAGEDGQGGHCKTLVPTYEKVATTLNQEADVVNANLNVDKYKVLAEKYGVSGYPGLEFFPKNNKAGEDYDDNRDLDDGMIVPTQSELGIKYNIETLLEETVVGYADNFIQVKSLSNKIIGATKLMFTGIIESGCQSSIQSLFHYRHRPRTFDPGGEVSPKLMFAMLFIVPWVPP